MRYPETGRQCSRAPSGCGLDLGRSHAHGGALEPLINQMRNATGLGAVWRHDGRLRARIDKCLDSAPVDNGINKSIVTDANASGLFSMAALKFSIMASSWIARNMISWLSGSKGRHAVS